MSEEQDLCVVLFDKEISEAETGEKPYISVATCASNGTEAGRKMRRFLEENRLKGDE
ncbi:hypothetical protein [Coleofasciculus sp. E1-EBD-02]|uniref:hypothetical protein n=1 Tax=Coleofasciculus sp. E1-EBD-02 TaxID=3068481 RepID=UPI0032FB3861